MTESLLAIAEARRWTAPPQSWAAAQMARAAALVLQERGHTGGGELATRAALALGATLNALGDFAQAEPLLSAASDAPLLDNPFLLVRVQSELAISYAALGQKAQVQEALTLATAHRAGVEGSVAAADLERAEGLCCLAQNRYPETALLLQRAGAGYLEHGHLAEAVSCWADLSMALRYVNLVEAAMWLETARGVQQEVESAFCGAHCDYVLGLLHEEQNEFASSLPLFERARLVFEREGAVYRAAECDRDRGLAHYRLNQYGAALEAYSQARAFFARAGYDSAVATCDVNIAIVYYDTHHYDEALALLERVAAEAETEGRSLRTARCYTNMGLCYDRLGQYDRALVLHDRARDAFLAGESPLYAARCQENLAGTYRQLGRLPEALAQYGEALALFTEAWVPAQVASCLLQMVELHLSMGAPQAAKRAVEEALRIYTEMGMTVSAARCLRHLAEIACTLEAFEQVLPLLEQARAVFRDSQMVVEQALCDLVDGEARLANGEVDGAEAAFLRARSVLVPAYPDQAWRVEAGLGGCARARGALTSALDHLVTAASFIGQTRDRLPTEALSSTFYAERQDVFEAAIELAVDLGADEVALGLVETSKARTLLAPHQLLHVTGLPGDEGYRTGLVEQEAALRREIQSRRAALAATDQREAALLAGEPLRGGQPAALDELADVSRRYEGVVERLRLLASGRPERAAGGFSLSAFRQAAAGHLPEGWGCLAYFLMGKQLLIFFLDAHVLKVRRVPLTREDCQILHECASAEPERRELVYRGSLRGFPIPTSPGMRYRRHLGQLLLPLDLFTPPLDVLVVLPHGLLHGLPFHALVVGEQLLLETAPVTYAPTLQMLHRLWATEPASGHRDPAALICGLEQFEGEAPLLPHAPEEVRAVEEALVGDVRVLFGPQATAAQLLALSREGWLAQVDILHLATHALTDPLVPALSHVLLADGALTFYDILGLRLRARLVTLSACQAATAAAGPGDEMMSLARAFLHAGAQAVVASLWSVEDAATAELMSHFYRALQRGRRVPQALREAQLAMIRAGHCAYQWAPFVALGEW
ncbi:MAG TPA: CHAT domain-containing tetratricopeptide repeat protein [Ardenticatenaceae bacterium]